MRMKAGGSRAGHAHFLAQNGFGQWAWLVLTPPHPILGHIQEVRALLAGHAQFLVQNVGFEGAWLCAGHAPLWSPCMDIYAKWACPPGWPRPLPRSKRTRWAWSRGDHTPRSDTDVRTQRSPPAAAVRSFKTRLRGGVASWHRSLVSISRHAPGPAAPGAASSFKMEPAGLGLVVTTPRVHIRTKSRANHAPSYPKSAKSGKWAWPRSDHAPSL